MLIALSSAMTSVALISVVIVLGILLSIRNFKGQKKEAAKNEEYAKQSGLDFVHMVLNPPTNGYFKVFKHPNMKLMNIAIDPKNADYSLHLYYYQPQMIRVKGGGPQGTHYNHSVAIVTTGFWLNEGFAIYRRGRLSRKNQFQSHNEAFDQMYRVKSKDMDIAATVLTPAFVDALVRPPFEFKKKDEFEIIALGPQMMIQCQAVEFEKRVELLRWMQHLVTLVDTQRVPNYGQVKAQISQGDSKTLPSVTYVPVGGAGLTVDDSYDLDDDERDDATVD